MQRPRVPFLGAGRHPPGGQAARLAAPGQSDPDHRVRQGRALADAALRRRNDEHERPAHHRHRLADGLRRRMRPDAAVLCSSGRDGGPGCGLSHPDGRPLQGESIEKVKSRAPTGSSSPHTATPHPQTWWNASATPSADGSSLILSVTAPATGFNAIASAYGRATWPITLAFNAIGLPVVPWCFTLSGLTCYNASDVATSGGYSGVDAPRFMES